MTGTTLSYDGMGSLVLLVVADQAPERGEWKSYVDFLRARVVAHGKVRLIVVAGSGAPDAVQRKQLTDAVSTGELRTAVVSDSLVARGVVTAFRWSGLELDAFKLGSIELAYQFVQATAEELAWLRQTLAGIQAAMAVPRTASR